VYAIAPRKLQGYWTASYQIYIEYREIIAIYVLNSEMRYSNLFRNTMVMNDSEYAYFADFDHKIGCHGEVR